MTYKKIVKNLIREEADKLVREALKESGIEYRYTTAFDEDVKMENDKDTDQIFWDAIVRVTTQEWREATYKVGGTADDCVGICASVIWDAHEDYKALWYAVKSTREFFDIKALKIG